MAKQNNIQKVAKFLELKRVSLFAKVLLLIRTNKFFIKKDNQKTSKLLETFYLLFSNAIAEKPKAVMMFPVKNPDITLKEVKRKIFSTKP